MQCNIGGGRVGWLEKNLQVPPPHKKRESVILSPPILGTRKMDDTISSTTSSTITDTITEIIPKKKGRPKGSVKLTLQRVANNPELLKTDGDKLKELKGLLISSRGKDVVEKALEIAMNDEHPHQGAMIKLCMDRLLPVSLFEKDKAQRSAVTINITGIDSPQVIEGEKIG